MTKLISTKETKIKHKTTQATQTTQTKSTNMRKTVNFSPLISTTENIKSSSKISQSERKCTWYQRSELQSFRTNAKMICRSTIRKRKLSSMSDDDKSEKSLISTEDSEVCMRGLELVIDEQRKKRKRYTNKIIVAAQKSMKENELGTLSSNLSSWARNNAIKDARFDFLAVCPIYMS